MRALIAWCVPRNENFESAFIARLDAVKENFSEGADANEAVETIARAHTLASSRR
jgi:hypothetical protein